MSKIIRFIVEKMWPWVKRYVWPILREHVIEIFSWVIDKLKSKIKEWVDNRYRARSEEATHNAEQAERDAQGASSDAEREKQEAIAQVWREVAEKFRQDNEALKAEINWLTESAEMEFENDVRASDPNIDKSQSNLALEIGGRRWELPDPSSSDD